MSVKDILVKRVMSEEEAAKVWAVSNSVAIITHSLAWALGVFTAFMWFHK